MHKLKLLFLQLIVGLTITCSSGNLLFAQSNISNKYGLKIVKNLKILQNQIKDAPLKEMVNLKTISPHLLFDLKYTTANNFMHKKLYPPVRTTWLRKPAADALAAAAAELQKQQIGIKIFDGYRPYSVTVKMWEPIQDDRYAADPARGSGHNRGTAIDLTLYDLTTGKELPMPTGFDNFSDTAHHAFSDLPENILKNRHLLRSVMEKHGFLALSTEWWHYYLPDSKNFELLDIPFSKLKKLK